MDETQLIGIGDRDTGECSQIVVFDFAPNPPFCVHDGNELTGELSSVNRKSEGFHILLPNQAATRGYPFVIFISKELTNFESTKYLNSFKWPLAISMLAVFIFVGAQFMKYQNK